MGQFGQFGLNGFEQGQTYFSQLHISLDPDKLESCIFVCSLITVMRAYYTQICQIFVQYAVMFEVHFETVTLTKLQLFSLSVSRDN